MDGMTAAFGALTAKPAAEERTAPIEHWAYQVDTPFRPVHEILETASAGYEPGPAMEEELSWSGSAEQIAFREAVLKAHLAWSEKRKGPPGRDLAKSERGPVAGTSVQMRKDAAAAAGRLIAAANEALAQAKQAGHADALKTRQVTATSGYRGRAHQARAWQGLFPRYYNRTARQRQAIPSGPHSPEAVTYMITDFGLPNWIAAPGYSNHQAGIAIDLQQVRDGPAILNSSRARHLAAWKRSWLHGWLAENAASYGFQPYPKEPWHWECRPSGSAREAEDYEPRFEPEELSRYEEGEEIPTEAEFAIGESDLEQVEPEDSARAQLEPEALAWEDLERDVSDREGFEPEDFTAEDLDQEDAGREDSEWEDFEPEGSEPEQYEGEDGELEDFKPARAVMTEQEPAAFRSLDPALVALAERIAAPRPLVQGEVPRHARRWTPCFAAKDIDRLPRVYDENKLAAAANGTDRCACIVMLNVALGRLLPIRTKLHPARSRSSRRVRTAVLTTDTIEKAMAQLEKLGLAKPATRIDFLDRNGRRAGTLKPERLQSSVKDAVLAQGKRAGCWYAYGLSIMAGYHSVLLLVDRTSTDPRIYWLDQYSSGINDDVTLDLDQQLTDRTQRYWQGVMDEQKKGYETPVRIWQLGRPLPSYRPEPASGPLELGHRGPRTQALQAALQALGTFSERVDGHFGYDTDRAVRTFQQVKRLSDDGVAGRDTLRELGLKL